MAQPGAPVDFSEEAIAKRCAIFKEKFDKLSSSTVDRPTLIYLDIGGIGWPIRCMFAVAGVAFDDIRITFTDWMGGLPSEPPDIFSGIKEIKPIANANCRLFPAGHVPVYVDQDVHLWESLVIMEYLAKKFGLMGDSFQEELLIKQVLVMAYDSIFHYDGIFNANFGKQWKPAEYARGMCEKFVFQDLPDKLKMFTQLLTGNTAKSGFIVGTRLSIADLFVFHVLCNWYKCFIQGKPYTECGFPELESYIRGIAGIPAVAGYISARQAPTTWLPGPWGAAMGLSEQLSSPSGLAGLVAASPEAGGGQRAPGPAAAPPEVDGPS